MNDQVLRMNMSGPLEKTTALQLDKPYYTQTRSHRGARGSNRMARGTDLLTKEKTLSVLAQGWRLHLMCHHVMLGALRNPIHHV